MVSWILGVAIFGYASWTIYRFMKKSRQGKCAACSLNKSCQSQCFDSSVE
ncbi:FeoB-associated Cys-rich membrane protein [Paenibacillus sp. J5C_2022]|nr:FeoB-associated Cys-rich membrane protein [Paenibacillus sp. J5C2022]MCU6707959.1 FeoB-associated Cys-rich membrane protein [Paenibacillus sp. J5C2022]